MPLERHILTVVSEIKQSYLLVDVGNPESDSEFLFLKLGDDGKPVITRLLGDDPDLAGRRLREFAAWHPGITTDLEVMWTDENGKLRATNPSLPIENLDTLMQIVAHDTPDDAPNTGEHPLEYIRMALDAYDQHVPVHSMPAPRDGNPKEVIDRVMARAGKFGIRVSFDGENGVAAISPEQTEAMAEGERLDAVRAALAVVSAECGMAWADDAGATGYVAFYQNDIQIHGDDRREDWAIETSVDPDDPEFDEWSDNGYDIVDAMAPTEAETQAIFDAKPEDAAELAPGM